MVWNRISQIDRILKVSVCVLQLPNTPLNKPARVFTPRRDLQVGGFLPEFDNLLGVDQGLGELATTVTIVNLEQDSQAPSMKVACLLVGPSSALAILE